MGAVDPDFSTLYAQHLNFVWRNLRALGVPAEELEDAAQDTFVVAYRRSDDFRPDASMRAWLYGIARRVASRRRRGGGRRQRLLDAVAVEPQPRMSAEATVMDQELLAMAVDFLNRLPDGQREAFWLTEVEGLTAAEAGVAAGVSANTIGSRLRAARQSMARYGDVLRARDTAELQRALRRGHDPSAQQRRRAVGVVVARLGALTRAGGSASLTVWPWLLGAAAAGGLGWVVASGGDAPPPRTTAAPVERSVSADAPPTPPRPSPAPITAPDPPPIAAPRSSPQPKPQTLAPSRRAAPGPTRDEHTSTPTLEEEAALVRKIKRVVASDPARALVLAAEHAREFPKGILREEAQALRVQATCALGRGKEAAELTKQLPKDHPWASGCR